MQLPVQVSFRKVRNTPAIEDLIGVQTTKLDRVLRSHCWLQDRRRETSEASKKRQSFPDTHTRHGSPEHALVVTRESSAKAIFTNNSNSHTRPPSARCAASFVNWSRSNTEM